MGNSQILSKKELMYINVLSSKISSFYPLILLLDKWIMDIVYWLQKMHIGSDYSITDLK